MFLSKKNPEFHFLINSIYCIADVKITAEICWNKGGTY